MKNIDAMLDYANAVVLLLVKHRYDKIDDEELITQLYMLTDAQALQLNGDELEIDVDRLKDE